MSMGAFPSGPFVAVPSGNFIVDTFGNVVAVPPGKFNACYCNGNVSPVSPWNFYVPPPGNIFPGPVGNFAAFPQANFNAVPPLAFSQYAPLLRNRDAIRARNFNAEHSRNINRATKYVAFQRSSNPTVDEFTKNPGRYPGFVLVLVLATGKMEVMSRQEANRNATKVKIVESAGSTNSGLFRR